MKNLKSKWMYVPIITGVLVLGSIAIVAGANENSAKDSFGKQQKDMLTNEEISKKAVAVVDGTVTKVEMEQKLRGTIYEVEIHKDGIEYDLDLDAFTGEVLKNEQSKDDDDDDFNQSDLSKGATDSNTFKVSMDDAIELALKEVTGTVEQVELESEHSGLFYKIEIADGSKDVDVLVDTESGKVSVEKDDDSDDDDDDENNDDD